MTEFHLYDIGGPVTPSKAKDLVVYLIEKDQFLFQSALSAWEYLHPCITRSGILRIEVSEDSPIEYDRSFQDMLIRMGLDYDKWTYTGEYVGFVKRYRHGMLLVNNQIPHFDFIDEDKIVVSAQSVINCLDKYDDSQIREELLRIAGANIRALRPFSLEDRDHE